MQKLITASVLKQQEQEWAHGASPGVMKWFILWIASFTAW